MGAPKSLKLQYLGLCMKYRNGYKYQLAIPEIFQTSFRPSHIIRSERITLLTTGSMTVHSGYAWDGASGIVDRDTNLRASLGHDALYQLMREGGLDYKEWAKADEDFCIWLKQAGAWDWTVSIDRYGLSLFKGKFAHPKERKKIFIA